MKLNEILNEDYSYLMREANSVWSEQDQLDEGVWNSMRDGFNKITNTFSKISQSSNSKNEMNDSVLRTIYTNELKKVKDAIDKMPDKVKDAINKILIKNGIKINGGVDLSRKNLNRIVILKIVRLIIFTMNQMKDNGVEWILTSAVSGGISMIISALMSAKDAKNIAVELKDSSAQLKTLFDKANAAN